MIAKTTKIIGDLGEEIAIEYLKRQGFQIVATNYKRKVAEIDIIASKSSTIHFIEVKSVSHGTKELLKQAVSHGTYRPEERIDQRKLHKIQQGIAIWLQETGFTGNYQCDVAAVRYVFDQKYANITYIERAHLK